MMPHPQTVRAVKDSLIQKVATLIKASNHKGAGARDNVATRQDLTNKPVIQSNNVISRLLMTLESFSLWGALTSHISPTRENDTQTKNRVLLPLSNLIHEPPITLRTLGTPDKGVERGQGFHRWKALSSVVAVLSPSHIDHNPIPKGEIPRALKTIQDWLLSPLSALIVVAFMLLVLAFPSGLGTFISYGVVGLPMASKIWTSQTGWIDGASVAPESKPSEAAIPIEPTDSIIYNVYKVNQEWAKYHLFSALGISKGPQGWYETGEQAIFRALPSGERFHIKTVGKRYELYPNEELQERLDAWANANGFKRHFKQAFNYGGSNGNALYLTYLPADEQLGSYFIRDESDPVRFGFAARNSIDGSVSFGLDSFSFRGLCTNGNIFGVSKQESHTKRHTKALRELIKNLNPLVSDLMTQADQLASFYQALAKLELKQKEAETLAQSYLPSKYLPFQTEVEEKQRIVVLADGRPVLEQKEGSDTDKGADLWSIFNNINGRIWHGEKADMQTKAEYMGLTTNLFRGFVASAPQTGSP